MFTTIETKIELNSNEELLINSMMADWAKHYHYTWKLFNNKHYTDKQIYNDLITKGLTSHQVASITYKVKSEHAKIKALTITQAKQQITKINNIQTFINTNTKKLTVLSANINQLKTSKTIDYTKLNKTVIQYNKLKLTIANKQIKLNRLSKSLSIKQKRIKTNTFKLCFGSSKLLNQLYIDKLSNNSNKNNIKHKFKINTNKDLTKEKPNNNTQLKSIWKLSRENQIYSIGNKNKPSANAEIQYNHTDKSLRIRLTETLADMRMKEYCEQHNIVHNLFISKIKYSNQRMQCRFITINAIDFNHRYLNKMLIALHNKQPISANIIKKLNRNNKIAFYLHLSFKEYNNLPVYSIDKITNKVLVNKNTESKVKEFLNRRTILGIDLNVKGLAYTIIKADGNRLVKTFNLHIDKTLTKYAINGYVKWDLSDNNANQNKQLISESIDKIIKIANDNGVKEIAIENLDFNQSKSNMNTGFTSSKDKRVKQYNKMLSSFNQSLFRELLIRKSYRENIIVKLVNPAYSSVGGYAKYGMVNKTNADISASLWLARQGLLGIPYKIEENVIHIKKYKELMSFPYLINWKQSKKELNKVEWKDVSSAIGKDRRKWRTNMFNYIKSLSGVDNTKELEIEDKLNNLFQVT